MRIDQSTLSVANIESVLDYAKHKLKMRFVTGKSGKSGKTLEAVPEVHLYQVYEV